MHITKQLKYLLAIPTLFLLSCNSTDQDADEKIVQSFSAKEPIALYKFNEGEGRFVHDLSAQEPKLNLEITNNERSEISWHVMSAINIKPSAYRIEKSSMVAKLNSMQPALKINQKIKHAQAFSVELWFHPDNVEQTGPVRLVSVSSSNSLRNVTIGHSGKAYDFRVRTSAVNKNGLPSLRTADTYEAKAALTHIVLTYDQQAGANIYIDGSNIPWFFYEGVAPGDQLSGNLEGWDDSYKLIVGDEFTGDRAWKGKMYQLAFYDYPLSQNEVLQKLSRAGQVVK